MNKQLSVFFVISEIIILLGFVSSHFLIGLHFNSIDKALFFWILSDIFIYLSIILQLIVIGIVIGVDYK